MRSRLLATSAAAALLISASAAAQDRPSSTQAPSQTPETVTTAEGADAPDQGGLEDIVVTAQRREESLQRAAIPVSAVSGDALIAAGASDTANLTKLVPALQIQPSGGTGLNLYLRGVGTLQGNSFGENPIAFNFNGVYIARPTAPVGTLFDLERVEVLKGPQGTLYGRNATGGAINVLPKRPRLGEFGGDATVEFGNYDSKLVNGAINVPIGDTLAVRVAAQLVNRDGNLSDGYNDEVGQAVRASVLFQPTDTFSATLVADYFHQGGKGFGSVLAPGSRTPSFFPGYAAPDRDERIGGSDPRSIAALQAYVGTVFAPPFCGGPGGFIRSGCIAPPRDDGFIDSTFYGVSATIEGDLGFGTLTVLPAWRRSKPKFRFYLPGFRGEVTEEVDQMSVEARLASNGGGPLRYVIGGYFFAEDQNASNFFFQGNLSTTRFEPRLRTESKAVFGELAYSLTPGFRIVGGARYSAEDRTQSTRLATGGVPGPIAPPLGQPNLGDLSFDKVTWKAGVELDAGPRSLLYATVATGFKAGGFFVSPPPNNTFGPETLTAYTLGSKNRFFDNRLQFNVEAFFWDYKDQQISFVGGIQTPTGVGSGQITINAGQAEMYGVEADLQFAVTPRGILTANVQYLHGEYKSLAYTALSATGAPVRSACNVTGNRLANPGTASTARFYDLNCSGRPTINSPEWTANIAYEHSFEVGGGHDLVLGARTRLESSRFVGITYLPELRQGSYMMSDASVTLEGPDDRWSLTGFVNNIEDATIISGGEVRPILNVVYNALRPPRTYGVRGSIRF